MCGEKLPKQDVDQLIDSLIEEDKKASTQVNLKVGAAGGKKTDKKPSKSSKIAKNKQAKPKTDRADKSTKTSPSKSKSSSEKGGFGGFVSKLFTRKPQNETGSSAEETKVLGLGSQITAYVTVVAVLVLIISMNFTWFSFGGRGAYMGIEETQSGQYIENEILDAGYNGEQIKALPEATDLYSFSGNDLKVFGETNYEYYVSFTASNGEVKESIPVKIQSYYMKAIPFILYVGLISIILLLIDRKLKTTEWTRAFSVLSLLVIGVNYMAVKIPFFSMIAIKAQTMLRDNDILDAVTMNLNGINVNNDFYPYRVAEEPGLFIAAACCVIWFILTTVLIEMKKDTEI
jgi:hypothetical protein